MRQKIASSLIYVNTFVVGSVLMGFEMLGSRYLFPYFGGGIGTWSALISTVLIALTIGYLIGGTLVDRYPSSWVVAVSLASAAAYLAAIPTTSERVIPQIIELAGEGPPGVLLASAVLLLVPMSMLGMLSPVAVRLLTQSASHSGRVAGLVYGVSTVGNVFGTLLTTFALIPAMGSRTITYVFSAVLTACALSLSLNPKSSLLEVRQ